MALDYNPPFIPGQEIPNGPFYWPETWTLQGGLGNLIVGTGLSVDSQGRLNNTGGGVGVTYVGVDSTTLNVTGSPITTTGTITINAPIGTALRAGILKAGVVGTNINVTLDGTISVPTGNTVSPGVVQLNNTTTLNSATLASTAGASYFLQQQINALAVGSNLVFGGTLDASTGNVVDVTIEGTARGLVAGSALPVPNAPNAGVYVVIVVASNSYTPPASVTPIAVNVGDELVMTSTSWVLIPSGFVAPAATTTEAGIVRLATVPEVAAGTDNTIAITPFGLAQAGILGGNPGGANTQVQYNDNGAFGASANFVWDDANKQLVLPNVNGAQGIIVGNLQPTTGNIGDNGIYFTGQETVALLISQDATPGSGNFGGDIVLRGGAGDGAGGGGSVSIDGGAAGLSSSGGDVRIGLFNTNNVVLPDVTNVKITGGNNGEYLQTDGAGNLTFAPVSTGTTPGGPNLSFQFNDGGAFNGDSDVVYNPVQGALIAREIQVTNNLYTETVAAPTGTPGGSAFDLFLLGGFFGDDGATAGKAVLTGGTFTNFNAGTSGTGGNVEITGGRGVIGGLGTYNGGDVIISGGPGSNGGTTGDVILPNVSNLKITGGNNGEFLQTDGAGNLVFAPAAGQTYTAFLQTLTPPAPGTGEDGQFAVQIDPLGLGFAANYPLYYKESGAWALASGDALGGLIPLISSSTYNESTQLGLDSLLDFYANPIALNTDLTNLLNLPTVGWTGDVFLTDSSLKFEAGAVPTASLSVMQNALYPGGNISGDVGSAHWDSIVTSYEEADNGDGTWQVNWELRPFNNESWQAIFSAPGVTALPGDIAVYNIGTPNNLFDLGVFGTDDISNRLLIKSPNNQRWIAGPEVVETAPGEYTYDGGTF